MKAMTFLKQETEELEFNRGVDCVYGLVSCLCFLVGTVGNIASYVYFRSKKKDISNTVYKFITLNDTLICLTVLPVGISFLTNRMPGLLLSNQVGCTAWVYLWGCSVRLSIFLVVCLCWSRTYSLIRPFSNQKVWPIHVIIWSYLLLQAGQLVGFHVLRGTVVKFTRDTARCELLLLEETNQALLLALEICMIFTYVVPVFVVIISCVVSVVVILLAQREAEERRARSAARPTGYRTVQGPREALRRSRNRATVTILLFAFLYGVCNVPIVVKLIIQTYTVHSDGEYEDFYDFDTLPNRYFHNATWTILLAVNSAVNPLLYFWRMPALTSHTVSNIRWALLGEPRRRISTSQGTAVVNQRMMYSLESEANLVVRNTTCSDITLRVVTSHNV